MKNIFLVFIFVSFILPKDHLNSSVNKDKLTFIDKIQTNDSEVQGLLNQLKKDFVNDRDQINQKYHIKKKTLKNQKNQEIEQINKLFQLKLDRIKNQYSDRINKPLPLPLVRKKSNFDLKRGTESKVYKRPISTNSPKAWEKKSNNKASSSK